jgi:glycosyltransferase involved in cell wall biosynthesis
VSQREPPRISVIVPTRDRPRALARCLEALAAQTVADTLEVIVVDDGSIAARDVRETVALHRHARLIRGAGVGPATARNRGAQHARGAALCFTDDDCVPDEKWAERLAEALDRGADAAAGTTLSGEGALAEASEFVARAPAAATGHDRSLPFAPSNNLACKRTVFEIIQFDESYPTAAGEDREWCARLNAAGYVLRLEEEARLVHYQDLTLGRFLGQQLRYGEGAYRFRRGCGEGRLLEPRSFYTTLLRRAFKERIQVGLLVSVAQVATAAGFGRAWLKSVLDSHFAAANVSKQRE